jgi:GTP-dependent dephospho-CoA kinase
MALTSWLRKNHLAQRAHIVPLDNKWGPAVLGDFDAMGVTADNKSVGIDINTVRKERGIPLLALIEVPLIDAEDTRPISSTRIRAGIIDREGHLQMPDSLRPELQKPLGRILAAEDVKAVLQHNRDNIVITVGDVTTQSAFLCGVRPALAIIDLTVERRPFQTLEAYKFPSHYNVVHVQSGPGYITKEATDAIMAWAAAIRDRKRTVLVVDGEEDLLTLPAILHAPLGAIVYYGQPRITTLASAPVAEGLVEVVVTKEKKEEVASFLAKFVE